MKIVKNQYEPIHLEMDLQSIQNFALSVNYVLRSLPEKLPLDLLKFF